MCQQRVRFSPRFPKSAARYLAERVRERSPHADAGRFPQSDRLPFSEVRSLPGADAWIEALFRLERIVTIARKPDEWELQTLGSTESHERFFSTLLTLECFVPQGPTPRPRTSRRVRAGLALLAQAADASFSSLLERGA
jgi:hypothetical protein